MKITKRNGNTTLYDDAKIVNSILNANQEVSGETISMTAAYNIADEVFIKLTENHEILTTVDVRVTTYSVLCEKGFPQTAKRYIEYRK